MHIHKSFSNILLYLPDLAFVSNKGDDSDSDGDGDTKKQRRNYALIVIDQNEKIHAIDDLNEEVKKKMN